MSGGLDPTGKIKRQVRWLNEHAELQAELSFNDVVHPLSRLDIHEAMSILKSLEKSSDQVEDPTSFVCDAASSVGGGKAASVGAALDPTGKISRQVAWLNRNCKLAQPLSYDDVVGPLSSLGITQAMTILKEVQTAPELSSPTAYVLGVAAQQGAIDAPIASLAGAPVDPTGKIARQVTWLNKNVQLTMPIPFAEVAGPLSALDIAVAMAILKEVESKGAKLKDASAFIVEQAKLAAASSPVRPTASAIVGGGAAVGGGLGAIDAMRAAALDPTGKIARQVKWLNANANLMAVLDFNQVVEPLSMLPVKDALGILKDLEETAAGVRNPTAYVATAAERVARLMHSGPALAMAPTFAMTPPAWAPLGAAAPTQVLDPTGKIARQVQWLNKNLPLKNAVQFDEVVQPLSALNIAAAMSILKDVEKNADRITNPTGYVAAAAARAAGGIAGPLPMVAAGLGGARGLGAVGAIGSLGAIDAIGCAAGRALDPTGKISRQVTWLNGNVQLAEPLSFGEVVGPLSRLDITAAMKILKDVETNAPKINFPTKYVLGAADRAAAAGGGTPIVPIGGIIGLASTPAATGTRRTWSQVEQAPANTDDSKQISRMVGRLNASVPLVEKLSYSDVKEALERIDLEAAMKILKDVEKSPGTIKSPTNYVLSAARRVRSGEHIPSKRARR